MESNTVYVIVYLETFRTIAEWPWNIHNPCKFVAALGIQGITTAFAHNLLVYNVLFDPYENAHTVGICGWRGGVHDRPPFSCYTFVGLQSPVNLASG